MSDLPYKPEAGVEIHIHAPMCAVCGKKVEWIEAERYRTEQATLITAHCHGKEERIWLKDDEIRDSHEIKLAPAFTWDALQMLIPGEAGMLLCPKHAAGRRRDPECALCALAERENHATIQRVVKKLVSA